VQYPGDGSLSAATIVSRISYQPAARRTRLLRSQNADSAEVRDGWIPVAGLRIAGDRNFPVAIRRKTS
jgi:hypothetical protein